MSIGKSLTINTYDPIIVSSHEEIKESTPVNSIHLDNVKNIRVVEETYIPYTIRNELKYEYSTLQVEFMDGSEKTYKNSHVDGLLDIEPDIEVYVIPDISNSDCRHKVEKYMAWSVWEKTTTDSWNKEQKTVQFQHESKNKDCVIQSTPMYRGVMAKFPDGEIRKYGNFERHSSYYNEDSYINSNSNTFNLSTSQGTIKNVVNVLSNKNLDYTVQKETGEYIHVDKIYDAEGSFYTVCLENNYSVHLMKNIESYVNTIGVFETEDEYIILVNSNSAGVHGGPKRYQINKSNVHNMHVKKPNGEIVNSISNIN